MRSAPYRPSLQVFVCAHRREAGDPLGPGCGDQGDSLWRAVRARIVDAGLGSRVWVTRTFCQGLCPKRGAAVSLSASGVVMTEADATDVDAIVADAIARAAARA